MATVARENIGLLNDKIVVKIAKEDYLPAFDKKLKEYSKTANIPGFRKGMVPVGMVKKMYGPSIFTDEVLRAVEKELYTYLDTERPEIFAQPMALDADIRSMDVHNPADYEFGFEIGLKPEVQLPNFAQAKLTLHKVEATDEMVQEEVERMQQKGGKLTEPETIGNPENIINVHIQQIDADGNVVEDGASTDTSLLLKYFTASAQTAFTGKKVNDTLNLVLNQALEGDRLDAVLSDLKLEKTAENGQLSFQFTITKIGLVEKRELDETFFNEVFPGAAIATEEEFRNKLKEEINQYWLGQSRNQLHDQIYHFLLDETPMQFPEGFLKRWLQNGAEQRKTAEEAEAEFPVFSGQLKWTLISDKIIRDNQLEVSQEELKATMKAEVMRYFGTMNLGEDTSWLDAYVDRMMKDEKQVDSSYRRLITEKLFNWAESQITPAEKTVTADELNAMQHHHH